MGFAVIHVRAVVELVQGARSEPGRRLRMESSCRLDRARRHGILKPGRFSREVVRTMALKRIRWVRRGMAAVCLVSAVSCALSSVLGLGWFTRGMALHVDEGAVEFAWGGTLQSRALLGAMSAMARAGMVQWSSPLPPPPARGLSQSASWERGGARSPLGIADLLTHDFSLAIWRPEIRCGLGSWLVVAPLWIPIVLSSGGWVFLAFRAKRYGAEHCGTCGYCLRGNTSGVCPESGTAVVRQSPVSAEIGQVTRVQTPQHGNGE